VVPPTESHLDSKPAPSTSDLVKALKKFKESALTSTYQEVKTALDNKKVRFCVTQLENAKKVLKEENQYNTDQSVTDTIVAALQKTHPKITADFERTPSGLIVRLYSKDAKPQITPEMGA